MQLREMFIKGNENTIESNSADDSIPSSSSPSPTTDLVGDAVGDRSLSKGGGKDKHPVSNESTAVTHSTPQPPNNPSVIDVFASRIMRREQLDTIEVMRSGQTDEDMHELANTNGKRQRRSGVEVAVDHSGKSFENNKISELPLNTEGIIMRINSVEVDHAGYTESRSVGSSSTLLMDASSPNLHNSAPNTFGDSSHLKKFPLTLC